MNNKMYDPQAESLKVYWESQQERLKLLSGVPLTSDILNLTSSFGESEIQAFEKLMQTQKELAALLMQPPLAPVAAEIAAPKGVPNPVIDNLDLSDPRTVRRFDIRSVERNDVQRGECMVPSSGILLMLGRKDAYTDAMVEFFTGKGLTINWGAWDGGMMDYIYRKTLTEKGYVLIPLEVGANYFANEFLNGLPSGQILISNNDKPVDLTRPAE